MVCFSFLSLSLALFFLYCTLRDICSRGFLFAPFLKKLSQHLFFFNLFIFSFFQICDVRPRARSLVGFYAANKKLDLTLPLSFSRVPLAFSPVTPTSNLCTHGKRTTILQSRNNMRLCSFFEVIFLVRGGEGLTVTRV